MKTNGPKTRLSVTARARLALVLLPIGPFCGFGFLAAFEPDEPALTWTFRAIYCGFGLASLLGMICLLRPDRSRSQPSQGGLL